MSGLTCVSLMVHGHHAICPKLETPLGKHALLRARVGPLRFVVNVGNRSGFWVVSRCWCCLRAAHLRVCALRASDGRRRVTGIGGYEAMVVALAEV